MSELWPWLAVFGLGMFHGINPAMGWLFAVALGLQERKRSAVLRALPPIALGHALSIAIIITAVLVSGGLMMSGPEGKLPGIPLWVVLSCHAAIALGTMSGGWRIVHTMGSRLTKLRPIGGFAAETAGAITLAMATYGGIPVSTTHTITGAIVGVGATRRLSAVRWGVARTVVWAWVLTIPLSALIAAITYLVVLIAHKL